MIIILIIIEVLLFLDLGKIMVRRFEDERFTRVRHQEHEDNKFRTTKTDAAHLFVQFGAKPLFVGRCLHYFFDYANDSCPCGISWELR
jgi:hypothetical protein